jgi:uncharacterized SAM-binding protein YcdF (DUF218 family)
MSVSSFVFFVSKLLPIFIYPLGLVCLLMLAVFVGGSRRRWQSVALGMALALLWLASSRWVGMTLVHSLEWQYLPPQELAPAEAIVVLGGATEPRVFPRPDVHVLEAADRLFYAARLFHDGKAPTIVVSAGRSPFWGSMRPESSAMAVVLQELGVPADAIIQEDQSRNTYENALETRKILEPRGIRRILLVTSALHMPRAVGIFRHQGIEVLPAPTDFITTQEDPYGFRDGSFGAVLLAFLPEMEGLAYTTRGLKEYVGLAVYRLRGLID